MPFSYYTIESKSFEGPTKTLPRARVALEVRFDGATPVYTRLIGLKDFHSDKAIKLLGAGYGNVITSTEGMRRTLLSCAFMKAKPSRRSALSKWAKQLHDDELIDEEALEDLRRCLKGA